MRKGVAVLRTVLEKLRDNPGQLRESVQLRSGQALGHPVCGGLGLISPFYELIPSFGSGAIGLFILFWGMQYAWKAMAAPKVYVDGPLAVIAVYTVSIDYSLGIGLTL